MTTDPRLVRAVAELPTEYHDDSPITIRPGEALTVTGDSESDFPAFVPVRTAGGGSGWVPSRHLSPDRPLATVVTAYDTTVLHVTAGQVLTLLAEDRDSGWAWCADERGREGWVPYRLLDTAR